ncbi:50S ribosomal protein L7/L12 [Nonomuraea dietziae]|uniref:50S ribosomal protein L7/L12 n=1 Tax=Nonomuraea dietziae TaxID=65515 RepID=UPI0034392E8A
MPNIGVPEILMLLTIVGIIAAIIAAIAISAGKAARGRTPHPMITPTTPAELEHQLRALVNEGKTILAIKILRQHTGLSLQDAKTAVDGMRAGRRLIDHPAMTRLPQPPPRLHQADLATRVRELKAAGREQQAVHLVIGETGMTQGEAQTFVQAL